MRPLFSLRFVATVLALLALVAGLWLVFGRESDTIVSGPAAPVLEEHRIDLIHPAVVVQSSGGFAMVGGRTTAEIRIALDADRTMVITPNTPGIIDCPQIDVLGGCVVAADLLGDAVVWFALISGEPRNTVTLPPIQALREGNRVLLTNGWDVARAPVVERKCADDTSSLGDFVTTFGRRSTSTFNFEQQQIVRVTCTAASTGETVPGSTVVESSIPVTTVDPATVVGGSGVVDTIGDESEVTPST